MKKKPRCCIQHILGCLCSWGENEFFLHSGEVLAARPLTFFARFENFSVESQVVWCLQVLFHFPHGLLKEWRKKLVFHFTLRESKVSPTSRSRLTNDQRPAVSLKDLSQLLCGPWPCWLAYKTRRSSNSKYCHTIYVHSTKYGLFPSRWVC